MSRGWTLMLVGLTLASVPLQAAGGSSSAGSRSSGLDSAASPVRLARLPAEAPLLHTRLEATFPAADSLYEGEVRELRLRYSTAVQLPLSTVRLRGPAGDTVRTLGLDTVPGAGSAVLRLGLAEPLPSGAYTVEWRTAGPDNHPIEGDYGFTVERPEPEPPPDTAGTAAGAPGAGAEPGGEAGEIQMAPTGAAGSGAQGPRPLGVAVRWLFFASIAGMLGCAVFRFTVVPVLSVGAGWAEAARAGQDGLRRLAVAAAVLGVAALPARFGVQAAAFFGAEGISAATAWALLTSPWGAGWGLEALAVAGFVGGLVLARSRPRPGWMLMLAAAALVTVVPALSGHAQAVDPALRSLAIVVDALHVAAAAIWLGGLGALVIVGIGAAIRAPSAVGPAGGSSGSVGPVGPPGGESPGSSAGGGSAVGTLEPRAAGPAEALSRVVDAFSRVALTAVAGLFATGVVTAWLHLGSFEALWASAYGRTLAVKLALVAIAASLGWYNWRVVRPTLRQSPRSGLIRGPASVELVVGLAILLVTAVLVASPLPGGG